MGKTVTKIEAKSSPSERKRVAAYARVSCGKEEMLQSLAAQVSYYSELIQSHPEWQFAGIFADEDQTGTKDTRPEFQLLLENCRLRKVDMVITKAISRFARNTVHLLETTRELKSLGIDVFFEEEEIHSMSGDGELMLTLLASYAQEESRSVSENCKWRIRKRYEDGMNSSWNAMYGFTIKKGEVTINPEQATVVRQIFADYINGMGCSMIARKLNEQGVPAYFGGKWNAGGVMGIIRNEKVKGDSLLQKTFVANHLTKKAVRNTGQLPQFYAEGTHEGIINAYVFEAAQKIRIERAARFKVKDNSQNRYPFSGQIVCGICGKHYRRHKNNAKWTWQCGTYLAHSIKECTAKQIPETVLLDLAAEHPGFTEIRVTGDNTMEFVFSDGKNVICEWQYKSRAESWTEKMKQAAREKAKEVHDRAKG